MVKLLFRKLFRDLWKSLGTYLVCIGIVAMGLTGYSVLSILGRQLSDARDVFYDETAFADVFVELYGAPVSVAAQLAGVDGVSAAQGRITQTVRLSGASQNAPELKLISYEDGGLNLPYLIQGTYPEEKVDTLLLGNGFFEAWGYDVGDPLALTIQGAQRTFTISGSSMSPETVYMVKTIADLLPNPAQYDAAYLPYETTERLFSMPGRCNEIILTLHPGYSLSDLRPELEDILTPYGYIRIYDHSEHLSTSVLDMEIEQIQRMSTAIPFLFLFIAAIVLYISLNRLIERQRTQIGTLMALGFSPYAVSLHYTTYGTVIGLLGGFLGGILGNLCAGPLAEYFRSYFSLPPTPVQLSLTHILTGAILAAVFCSVVSGIPAYTTGGLSPADAMRPAPPKTAKKTAIEKIPFLFSLFTVSGRMAVRGLFRNKRKAALSLFGIACAYMITTTLVSMSALFDVFLFDDLEKSQQQDITVSFSSPVLRQDALGALSHPDAVHMEGVMEVSATLRSHAGETDALIQGISQDADLLKLYTETGQPIAVPDEEIVLSVHVANQLGVGVGDWVELEVPYPQRRSARVQVTGLAAQYLGTTAYMSYEGLGRVSDYQNTVTSVLVQGPESLGAQYGEALAEADHVAGVRSRWEVLDQYRGMMGSVSGIMTAMAAMGVLIGTAVVYVSSIISFEESKRDISTMMMLGLGSRQCLEVISVGQWLLCIGSFLPGIPMTYGVSYLLTLVIAGSLFSIPAYISPGSLLLGGLLTLLTVFLSSAIIHRKLKRIVPIDYMRDRE